MEEIYIGRNAFMFMNDSSPHFVYAFAHECLYWNVVNTRVCCNYKLCSCVYRNHYATK